VGLAFFLRSTQIILTRSTFRLNLIQMSEPAELLRTHGLPVTAQRVAILKAVSGRPHGTADDIAEDVRAEIGTISRQAVYNALGTLAENGLIRRIQPLATIPIISSVAHVGKQWMSTAQSARRPASMQSMMRGLRSTKRKSFTGEPARNASRRSKIFFKRTTQPKDETLCQTTISASARSWVE